MRFDEDPPKTVPPDAAPDTTTVEDTAVVDAATDAPPTVCDRSGGYAVVDKAMTDLIPKLKADCRIDRFFVAMDEAKLAHMRECMALQLASIMRCSKDGVRVKYPTLDSKGVQCRDMLNAHKTVGVHAEDFDAMIDDMLAVLGEAKTISAADLAAVAEVLRFQRQDIVNPGDAGRGDACASEASAPVDTGEEY